MVESLYYRIFEVLYTSFRWHARRDSTRGLKNAHTRFLRTAVRRPFRIPRRVPKNKPPPGHGEGSFFGTPEGIRTPGLLLRRL